MSEKLPIWFQALAIILLSCVFVVTLRWVWWQERTSRDMIDVVERHEILQLGIPVPIIFLGARFFCQVCFKQKMKAAEAVLSFLALASVVPALLAIGLAALPARQRVREGGNPSVSFSRPMEGRISPAK
jgi:hypothetical protein